MNPLTHPIRFLMLASGFLLAVVSLPGRLFTDAEGRQIEAEIIDIYETSTGVLTVELKRADRRHFMVAVDRFSAEDQDFIRGLLEKRKAEETLLHKDARISINLRLNRKTDTNDRYASYYGSRWTDKTKVYAPEVVIENEELTQEFKGNEVRVVIIARDKGNSSQYLVASATDVKVDLPPKERTSVEGDSFALREYEYESGLSTYSHEAGYEKDDYVVVIRNRRGEITHTRASSIKFLDNLETVLKCRAGQIYTDGLAAKLSVSPNSYYMK
ncbi:MAG: hypothetical protein ACLFRP_01635 [Puniceicoccaceae bacterium]